MVKCKSKNCYNEALEYSRFCADCQIEEDDDSALREEWGMDDEDDLID